MRQILFLMTFLFLWTNLFAQINECDQDSLKRRVIFKEINYDTTRSIHEVEIESKMYSLDLLFYSLNDSLLPETITCLDAETGKGLDSYIRMTHNNQGRIALTKDGKNVFSLLIGKSGQIDHLKPD